MKNKFFYLLVVLTFTLFQFFWVPHYLNDKTVSLIRMIRSMSENHLTPYSQKLPCYFSEGNKREIFNRSVHGIYNTWAEEPPVFHYLGIFFRHIFGDKNYVKIYSAILTLLAAFGFSLLIKRKYILLYLFIPALTIHFNRLLPDHLALVFLLFSLVMMKKNNWAFSWIFGMLSVTTKALSIFPLAFFTLGILIQRKNFNEKKLSKLIMGGFFIISCALPFFIWLKYLELNHIENPFFLNELSLRHHSGGSDFNILFSRKYWSRLLTWVAIQGVSLPIFVIALYSMLKNRKKWMEHIPYYFSFFGHLLYVILVRGPQFSAPWYSFYFLFVYLYFAQLIELPNKVMKVLISFILIYSLSFLDKAKNPSWKHFQLNENELPVDLPCEFHRFFKK